MQKTTGRDSAPIARDNAPVTVFAHEGKAPTGADTVKPVKAPTPVKSAPVLGSAPAATGASTSRTALPTATPKPAKAPKADPKPVAPKGKALADVVKKQTDSPHTGNIAGYAIYVHQREAAGQARKDAVDAVLNLYRELTLGLLAAWDADPEGDIRRDVLDTWVAANLPNANRRGTAE